MAGDALPASGVQELIKRIRDDGVAAGKSRAEEIVDEARREAALIIDEANTQAEATRAKAAAEIESYSGAALEALKIAARDTRLQLEAEILARFQEHVKRLVAPVTYDGEFIRALVLELAGQASDQYPRDQELKILVSDLLLGREGESETLDATIRESVLGISGNMLREGVEIIPSSDVTGGARVRVVGQDVEIDLTDEAIGKLLLKHLLPRYRAILEGAE